MFYLFAHMWLWMLLAALCGGLIGWALRCRRCSRETEALVAQRDTAVAEAKTLRAGGAITSNTDSRVTQLESDLAAERDEIAGLKAKLATATAAGSAGVTGLTGLAVGNADEGATDSDGMDDIKWRNRYLESRVRFLEGKLAETEPGGTETSGAEPSSDEGLDSSMDQARLKWRNRYLEGRVRYLEEDAAIAQRKPENSKSLGVTAFTASMPVSSEKEGVKEDAVKSEELSSGAESKPKKKSKKSRKTSTKTSVETASIAGLTGAAFFSAIEKDEGYVASGADGKPATLKAAFGGKADDLREIAGVGPKLEKLLHELGIFHFAQIASWTEKEIDWVDERLTFKGRIRRENWIDQCKLLAKGEETDGQRKYREGKQS
ncbi:MAG: hypothetical protein CME88_06355 [Hirschia sp.]|nr:hypothetical protein [Hirschia sp.]|tara:strand:+ start:5564 stop:6691 length:1128 start_codon:yes stop_codon:yes gene_type:complete